MTTLLKSGTVMQGSLNHDDADYGHQNIGYPVLGIVLSVYFADDPLNAISATFQDGKGYACQARVLVVNDGTDQPWILPNVVVTPGGCTGADDFHEEVPKGISGALDGSVFDAGLRDVPLNKLDGDWCLVSFIGGNVHQPVMVSWFPHPANRADTTVGNHGNTGSMAQGRRLVRRFQGTRLNITAKGDIVVDTNEANQPIIPGTDGAKRTPNEEGGDIYVNVKQQRELEINFNPSVQDKELPDVLRPPGETQKERTVDLTTILANKDLIRAIAGQVMELFAFSTLHLGKEADADENFVLGQAWKTMMNTVLTALAAHIHPTGVGPSGPPTNAATYSNAASALDDQLSDWIFGQKTAPTP